MGLKIVPKIGGLLLLILFSNAQEDSLKSALNAVDRRQKDLSEFSRFDDGDYGYSFEGPEDLTFISDPGRDKNPALERLLLDYLEGGSYPDDDKKFSSSFRERLEEDKEKQLEELADYLENSETDEDLELVKDLWQKYGNYPTYRRPIEKRYYYPRFGLDSAGLRKRNKYYSNYPRENPYNRYQEEIDYKQIYKRFPVSKRSSNYPQIIHEHKRSASKKDSDVETDPKVAKELSNVFGSATTEKTTTKPKINQSQKSKEEISGIIDDKPIQIKKKSIDWSDYFGLDRRKKSDDLDHEWVLERYHKAVALTDKRSAEYPLQSFKNHDQPSKKESSEEKKISDMDTKLKNIEETVIDDALKYTGAHEGTTDSQEIQEVKDRVISRLAAAYSLEKMRRALAEYKLSIAKEREKSNQQRKEEKRVSVPRKQAVDEERKKPEGDNNIKCSQGDEDCEEQNYKTPSEVLDQTAYEGCTRVQRACYEAATVLGHYAKVFEDACNMHQMCLLCSNNSWFAPTRQCNVLFLTKAFELCNGNAECQKEAQKSVRYLQEVNRSLRLEPLEECELACPDRR